jgi:hypothetical protein
MSAKLFLFFPLCVICFLAACSGYASTNAGAVSFGKLPAEMINLSGGSTPGPPGIISQDTHEFLQFPENREMIIDFPKTIWIGNSDQVKLTLRVIDNAGISQMNSPVLRNLFDKYDGYVETRLDVPGLELSPADPIQEPLIETYDNVFLWELTPKNAGLFRGNLWVFLNLYPKDEGQVQQIPLIIFPIEIKAIKNLGFTSVAARYLAVLLGAAGLFIIFNSWDGITTWLKK